MLCDQVREHLSAYLDRELTAELSAAVRAHLDACPDCRALLKDLRATVDLLGRIPAHAASEHLSEDVQREIERRAILAPSGSWAERPPQERTLALHRKSPWPRALAVAATLLLAAGIGIFAFLDSRTPTLTPEGAVTHRVEETLHKAAEGRPDAPAGKTGGALALKGKRAGEADEDIVGNGGFAKVEVARGDLPPAAELVPADAQKGGAPSAAAGAWAPAAEPFEPRPLDRLGAGSSVAETFGDAVAEAPVRRAAEGPVQVQRTMNWVANAEAPVEELKQVATLDNLKAADNTLIIQTASRGRANKDLQLLFHANDWRPVDEAGALASALDIGVPAKGPALKTAPADGLKKETLDRRAARGFYYQARQDGEDTWLIITDRAQLARFESQLATFDRLAVANETNELSRRIRSRQDRLRRDDKKNLAEGLRDTYEWSGEREAKAPRPPETQLGDKKALKETAEPSAEALPAEEGEAEEGSPAEASESQAGLAPAARKPEEEKAQEEHLERLWDADQAFRRAARLPEEQVLVVIRVQGPEAAIQTSEDAAKEPAGPTRPAAEMDQE
ncbi:MAG: zf-HC2 domain-containing protein [Phycisphaerae bacterium]